MKKLLPLLIALIGIGGGVGAGYVLRPAPEPMVAGDTDEEEAKTAAAEKAEDKELSPTDRAYVKLSNQFVVPVVSNDRVSALVVMSLSVEVMPEDTEKVYAIEPKLRDTYLQVMFTHANLGGFDGAFTASNSMDVLRRLLREATAYEIGEFISDVLITEIVRQDIG